MGTVHKTERIQASLPGDHRDVVPPDSIPNSEVKRVLADGSVGSPHVRVGHRQAFNSSPDQQRWSGLFYFRIFIVST